MQKYFKHIMPFIIEKRQECKKVYLMYNKVKKSIDTVTPMS